LNGDPALLSRELPKPQSARTGELVEAKTKGLATTLRAIAEPPKVISLMEALQHNLARDAEPEPKKAAANKPKRAKAVPNRRQKALLPVSGDGRKTDAAVAEPAVSIRQGGARMPGDSKYSARPTCQPGGEFAAEPTCRP
jgi:hypothetical protein